MRQTLLTGWHFMRWFRLGLGLALAIQAIRMHDAISGFIAVLFLYQAASNTGCCGSNGCALPVKKQSEAPTQDIEFEELKTT